MRAKWWLSLIKVFSLTSGILSFLLVWLFYIDHNFLNSGHLAIVQSCSLENVILIGFIFLVTMIIYFMVMRSQIPYRHKELFLKKYYGETSNGIMKIWLFETLIFLIISLVLSLVLIDQMTPIFNIITNREVEVQDIVGPVSIFILVSFLFLFGAIIGFLPSLFYIGKRAVDILKKLPR